MPARSQDEPRGDEGRALAEEELGRAVRGLGLPPEFTAVLARELRGEGSMRRMSAYLREVRPTTMEEIADELLAITSERDVWVERKVAEEANHRYYEMQRAGIRSADVDPDEPVDDGGHDGDDGDDGWFVVDDG